MTLALYVRCSTADQQPEAQLNELHEYAKRRSVAVREFIDHGESGRKVRLTVTSHREQRGERILMDRASNALP